MQRQLELEKEKMRRREVELLDALQKEYDDEKQARHDKLQLAKYAMRQSKHMSGESSGKDANDDDDDDDDFNVYVEFIERKYGKRLEDHKKQLEKKFARVLSLFYRLLSIQSSCVVAI